MPGCFGQCNDIRKSAAEIRENGHVVLPRFDNGINRTCYFRAKSAAISHVMNFTFTRVYVGTFAQFKAAGRDRCSEEAPGIRVLAVAEIAPDAVSARMIEGRMKYVKSFRF